MSIHQKIVAHLSCADYFLLLLKSMKIKTTVKMKINNKLLNVLCMYIQVIIFNHSYCYN